MLRLILYVILFMSLSFGINAENKIEGFCIGCICDAVSGCNRTEVCSVKQCGMLNIPLQYWQQAGMPKVQVQQDVKGPILKEFESCMRDPRCVAKTVRTFVLPSAKDCNGDTMIDCYDYLAIHLMGSEHCSMAVSNEILERFKNCQDWVVKNGGTSLATVFDEEATDSDIRKTTFGGLQNIQPLELENLQESPLNQFDPSGLNQLQPPKLNDKSTQDFNPVDLNKLKTNQDESSNLLNQLGLDKSQALDFNALKLDQIAPEQGQLPQRQDQIPTPPMNFG